MTSTSAVRRLPRLGNAPSGTAAETLGSQQAAAADVETVPTVLRRACRGVWLPAASLYIGHETNDPPPAISPTSWALEASSLEQLDICSWSRGQVVSWRQWVSASEDATGATKGWLPGSQAGLGWARRGHCLAASFPCQAARFRGRTVPWWNLSDHSFRVAVWSTGLVNTVKPGLFHVKHDCPPDMAERGSSGRCAGGAVR